MYHKRYYGVDGGQDLTVGHGATKAADTDYTAELIPIGGAYSGYITVRVKGSTTGTGNVTFTFAAYSDKYGAADTIAYQTVVIALTGTTQAQKTVALTIGADRLKLVSIANADGGADAVCGCEVGVNGF